MSIASILAALIAVLLGGVGSAHAGPCTAQIAQLERQIQRSEANPTAPQTVGAQLGRQPTPATVQNAERKAKALADAAIARARKADAAGNATACARALDKAKDLYGIR